MDTSLIILIVLAVVNILAYVLIGAIFFHDWDGFWEVIKFWSTPDFLSALRGEYWDNKWAQAKPWLFLVVCGALVYGEFELIQKLFFGR